MHTCVWDAYLGEYLGEYRVAHTSSHGGASALGEFSAERRSPRLNLSSHLPDALLLSSLLLLASVCDHASRQGYSLGRFRIGGDRAPSSKIT